MATGGSSSSNVPGVAGSGSGSGKSPMVPVGSIECLRKRCRLLRVSPYHCKAVVVLHGREDGKPDHIIVQNISPDNDHSVQSTFRLDVAVWSIESQSEELNNWYTSFRLDKTGVFYDSNQNVIFGVPRGHPGSDVPRSLAVLPPPPKKNERGKAPAAASSSSSADGPVLVVQTDQTGATDRRTKFTFPDQRKRIKAMMKNDLESYFHITQKEAAEIGLSIGTTALKSVCRANGLSKWPHRQILKLDNEFNNNLKKRITGWNLGKAIQEVTKAFQLLKKKEKMYEELMSNMPEQLQDIDEIVHSEDEEIESNKEDS